MGLIDFVKEAGEKLFGNKEEERRRANEEMAGKLTQVVGGMGLEVDNLDIDFNDGVATVTGVAHSQEEKEKVVLLVGNTQGVAQVDDRIRVEKPEPVATMYTVKSGDTLSKIAKEHYGDAMKYTVIFEANTPMLKDPNKIYPGQVLRIPPLAS